jgi:hypothetical protein
LSSKAPFSNKLKTCQSIGGAAMKNQKSLALIVATVMLFSFVAVPQANAFIGIVTIGVIIAASFASAVVVNETVIKPNNEAMQEQSKLKQKTPNKLQAVSEP